MIPPGINGSWQIFSDPTLINCTIEQWEKWACKGVCANTYGFVTCNAPFYWMAFIAICFLIGGLALGHVTKDKK
jgi:hypothetical protein